jgi:hypothetical protein
MADAGVGETLLAGEILGGGAAAETGGSLAAYDALGAGAGGAFTPSAGMGAGLFDMSAAGGGFGAGMGAGEGFGGWGAGNFMSADPSAFAPGWSSTGFNPTLADAGYGPGWSASGFNPTDPALAMENPAAAASFNQAAKNPLSDPSFMKDPLGWIKANPIKTAAAGAGIYTLANMLKGGALTKPNYLQTTQTPSAQSVGLGRTMASNYAPQRSTMYNRGYAAGGITVAPGSVPSSGVAPADLTHSSGIQGLMQQYGVTPQQVQQGLNTLGLNVTHAASGGLMDSPPTPGLMDNGASGNVDFMGGDMYPTSQQHRAYYATPTQMPTSAQATMASYEPKTNPLTGELTANMASGGIANLGSYSDGGRMLKGPGDGMSDNIPATIGGKQPARLADGEFVVPADVVSHLGNGSTDAGAKQLYSMMDKVRQARTGTKKQGKEINPKKYLKA